MPEGGSEYDGSGELQRFLEHVRGSHADHDWVRIDTWATGCPRCGIFYGAHHVQNQLRKSRMTTEVSTRGMSERWREVKPCKRVEAKPNGPGESYTQYTFLVYGADWQVRVAEMCSQVRRHRSGEDGWKDTDVKIVSPVHVGIAPAAVVAGARRGGGVLELTRSIRKLVHVCRGTQVASRRLHFQSLK